MSTTTPPRFRVQHLSVDDVAALLHLLQLRPLPAITGAAQREDDATVLALGLRDRGDHVVAHPELLRSGLAERDHTRRSLTEVDGRLVSRDRGNGPFDGFTDP